MKETNNSTPQTGENKSCDSRTIKTGLRNKNSHNPGTHSNKATNYPAEYDMPGMGRKKERNYDHAIYLHDFSQAP